MSLAVNPCKKSSDGFEDLFGGLGPDEWLGIGVPVRDPVADVVLQGLDGSVGCRGG